MSNKKTDKMVVSESEGDEEEEEVQQDYSHKLKELNTILFDMRATTSLNIATNTNLDINKYRTLMKTLEETEREISISNELTDMLDSSDTDMEQLRATLIESLDYTLKRWRIAPDTIPDIINYLTVDNKVNMDCLTYLYATIDLIEEKMRKLFVDLFAR